MQVEATTSWPEQANFSADQSTPSNASMCRSRSLWSSSVGVREATAVWRGSRLEPRVSDRSASAEQPTADARRSTGGAQRADEGPDRLGHGDRLLHGSEVAALGHQGPAAQAARERGGRKISQGKAA